MANVGGKGLLELPHSETNYRFVIHSLDEMPNEARLLNMQEIHDKTSSFGVMERAKMPKLRNDRKGDSNPHSITELPCSTL